MESVLIWVICPIQSWCVELKIATKFPYLYVVDGSRRFMIRSYGVRGVISSVAAFGSMVL